MVSHLETINIADDFDTKFIFSHENTKEIPQKLA